MQTSTYQMAVLLQFNTALTYSVDELIANTGLQKESVVGVLGILEKARLLQVGEVRRAVS